MHCIDQSQFAAVFVAIPLQKLPDPTTSTQEPNTKSKVPSQSVDRWTILHVIQPESHW